MSLGKAIALSPKEAWDELKGVMPLAALLSVAFFGAIWFFPGLSPGHDWGYFNGLSWVIQSIVWNYHRFPIQNPWVCGGLDILSNPQNRIFSPFGVLDLLLEPFSANVLTLVIDSFIGLLGSHLFFRSLGFSVQTSKISSLIFIGSSWFGLHFSVGHIVYGSLQLIPLFLWVGFRFDEKPWFIAFCLGYLVLVLSGDIYTVVFSFYAFLTAVFMGLGGLSWRRARQFLDQNAFFIGLTVSATALLSSIKLIPVIAGRKSFVQSFQSDWISPLDLPKIFFSPFQDPALGLMHTLSQFRYHEFGNYWGVPAFLIALWGGGFYGSPWGRKLLLAAGFWLWTALGWGGFFNPWTLHQFSFFSDVHVQSRAFIIADVFFALLFAVGFEKMQLRSAFFYPALSAFFVFECLWSRNYPLFQVYLAENAPVPRGFIESQTIKRTIPYGFIPFHYSLPDTGSKNCYEPSLQRHDAVISFSKKYQGEIYQTRGGQRVPGASLTKYVPGLIQGTLKTAQSGDVIHFNTNFLTGWRSVGGALEISSEKSGLLQARVLSPVQNFSLEYSPRYLAVAIFGWAMGLALFLYSLIRWQKKS